MNRLALTSLLSSFESFILKTFHITSAPEPFARLKLATSLAHTPADVHPISLDAFKPLKLTTNAFTSLADQKSPLVKAADTDDNAKRKLRKKTLFDLAGDVPVYVKKNFTFTTAASGMPKRQMRKVDQKSQFLSIQCGEDAFFVRSDAIGVADGVGGWNEVPGANPSLYSRKLMHYASLELELVESAEENLFTDAYFTVQPEKVLRSSYDKLAVDCKNEGILGSCTALVAILRDDELRLCNLGDCGLMVIRKDAIVFRSEEQQHSFNFPYQLGVGSSDTPEDAFLCKMIVQEGDLVIVGTDGLFDNVFDEEILQAVRLIRGSQSASRIDPKTVSDALLARARETGESRNGDSPFSVKALQKGLFYQGGKMDDMTVLVALVKLSEDSPDRR